MFFSYLIDSIIIFVFDLIITIIIIRLTKRRGFHVDRPKNTSAANYDSLCPLARHVHSVPHGFAGGLSPDTGTLQRALRHTSAAIHRK